MSKLKIAGVVLAVVALLGGGVLLAQMSSEDKTTDSSGASDAEMKMEDSTASTDTSTTSEASTSNTVEIKDFAFSPATITVKKGTKVTWTNQDSVQHNVMTDTDGKGPSSELLSKGESYSFTFDEVGIFKYHCTPHPQMQGTVIVTE